MWKIISFFKKYWVFLVLGLIIILFILNKVLGTGKSTNKQPNTPKNVKIATFNNITPGKSTLDEVNKVLGTPLNTNSEGDKTVADYKSSNRFRDNIVIVQNGVTELIKEVVNPGDTRNTQTINKEFGIPLYRLYEQKPGSVFDLYVYPDNGIAYLGHEDGTLLEIWYFKPMTLNDFINTWAPNYSTSKFEGAPQY